MVIVFKNSHSKLNAVLVFGHGTPEGIANTRNSGKQALGAYFPIP